MFKFPYRNFIRFLFTQGHSATDIQTVFESRSPFIPPTLGQLREEFYNLLMDANEHLEYPIQIHNEHIRRIGPKDLPSDDSPLLLPASEKHKNLAMELNVYELWAVVVGSEAITDIPDDELEEFKAGYNIFEKMTQPKIDICALVMADYPLDQITELINEQYNQDLSERSIACFSKYFWDTPSMSWSEIDRYVNQLETDRNSNKRINRLLRWALHDEREKMAFQMGYEVADVDAESILNMITVGEKIELEDHYDGYQELNAYERNKIVATMRQAYLFAKGKNELSSGGQGEELEAETVNPNDEFIDGHRDDEEFEEEMIEHAEIEQDDEEDDRGLPEGDFDVETEDSS